MPRTEFMMYWIQSLEFSHDTRSGLGHDNAMKTKAERCLAYPSRRRDRLRNCVAWTTAALAIAALPVAGAHRRPRVAPGRIGITLRATSQGYHNAPVTLEVAAALPAAVQSSAELVSADRRERLPCQVAADGPKFRLTFLLPDLAQGSAKTYLLQAKRAAGAPGNGVTVTPHGDDMDVFIGDGRDKRLFTTYTTHSGPNKPFFYPILTPEGQPMTRRWPLEENTGESHDHIHHRGLWFTHSSVNGIDFWTEQGKVGKTINTGYERVQSGPIYGGFRARTEWRAPDGKLVATDTRDVKIVPLPGGDRLLDFTITITPAGEPLTFGDNKDGMFGLRLPDSLAPHPDTSAHIAAPTGHILNAMGQTDGAAWGKPADWVDYWGPIGGKTYGVAMFDAPANLRHPETWHARDYALFTVNPFGLHDFHLGDKGAGDYIVPANGTLTFHYGVLFHHGDAATAEVAGRYSAWAVPPEIQVNGGW
jgi:hypothetical protein